jgi:hypothetical protein
MNAASRLASTALLALLLASTAHAANEVYLRWDDCYGDGGAYAKTFACDTNAGVDPLVGSFRLDTAVEMISATEVVIDLAVISGEIPAWWNMRTGGCRLSSSLTADFHRPATSTVCLDSWDTAGSGGAVGALSMQPLPGGGGARITGVFAVPSGSWFSAPAGQEIFSFQGRINHARTVDPSACAGCATPVCISLGVMRLHSPATFNVVQIAGWTVPDHGSNVIWQAGAVPLPTGVCPPGRACDSFLTCAAVTPVRVPTWGAIKTLYR